MPSFLVCGPSAKGYYGRKNNSEISIPLWENNMTNYSYVYSIGCVSCFAARSRAKNMYQPPPGQKVQIDISYFDTKDYELLSSG